MLTNENLAAAPLTSLKSDRAQPRPGRILRRLAMLTFCFGAASPALADAPVAEGPAQRANAHSDIMREGDGALQLTVHRFRVPDEEGCGERAEIRGKPALGAPHDPAVCDGFSMRFDTYSPSNNHRGVMTQSRREIGLSTEDDFLVPALHLRTDVAYTTVGANSSNGDVITTRGGWIGHTYAWAGDQKYLNSAPHGGGARDTCTLFIDDIIGSSDYTGAPPPPVTTCDATK
ncbi:hypothetical protein [Halodurantibacterium flavum]|uniref:Secreted protein n=1 Tax=Halodurantibacterium flavum TaxID=1382802 RepID=A0ABW4S243_9RHOB